jgi:hypothetical protein
MARNKGADGEDKIRRYAQGAGEPCFQFDKEAGGA